MTKNEKENQENVEEENTNDANVVFANAVELEVTKLGRAFARLNSKIARFPSRRGRATQEQVSKIVEYIANRAIETEQLLNEATKTPDESKAGLDYEEFAF